MKLPRARHRWDLTPAEAIRVQARLAREILHIPLGKSPRLVAGGDAAFTPDGTQVIAGWVVWDLRTKTVVATALALRPARFPYVPGLLSFREAPALLAAARKLDVEPDVFMFDGQGLAHPRRFGLACHVGLLMDRPSLGCAKSRLCGTPQPARPQRPEHRPAMSPRPSEPATEPACAKPVLLPGGRNEQGEAPNSSEATLDDLPAYTKGASCPLVHNGETIGRVLRTREGVKPLYISVGHRITLAEAVRLTLRCCTRYRLPEPTRLAHQLVTHHRNKP